MCVWTTSSAHTWVISHSFVREANWNGGFVPVSSEERLFDIVAIGEVEELEGKMEMGCVAASCMGMPVVVAPAGSRAARRASRLSPEMSGRGGGE